jgi:hypothetical protein
MKRGLTTSKRTPLRIRSVSATTRKNYCMDVFGNSRDENAPVTMFPCHHGINQKFKYNRKTRQLRGMYSNKCVDISSANYIVQRKCNPRTKTQKWKRSKGQFISVYNNKCLDVEGGDYNSGHLITWPCHKGPNQQFVLDRPKNAYSIPVKFKTPVKTVRPSY